MGEGLGRLVKKAKGLRSKNGQLQNNHGDIKFSIKKIFSNVIIDI